MVAKKDTQPKSRKSHIRRTDLSRFAMMVMLIAAVNLAGSLFFTRIDLTSEKRYTLSPATRDMLRQLDDHVYFRVYLEGDFPADGLINS